MPYIKKEKRHEINLDIQELINTLEELGYEKGDLNYSITLLVQFYIKHHGKSYNTLSDVTGVLNDVKTEFERRVVAPYEDKKIKENGDVYDWDCL